ncbi:hypothetical protein OAH86_09790 [Planktomarina temperata]|nr:hypothetical protein [Planktomarina temperata]
MTIQQHASFDSSAAELNATSKLVKAWESKNAKNAARAGGVSLMALSLAACGGSDDAAVDLTPFAQSDIDTAVATANEAAAAIAVTVANAAATAQAEAVAAVDLTTNDAEVIEAALTDADGITYPTVDAAITAAQSQDVSEAVAAAEAAILGDYADRTALIESNDAAVTATATDAAEATLVAGTGFASVAALKAAYDAASGAPTALNTELTTGTDVVQGFTATDDTVVGTQATLASTDVMVDSNNADNDTVTINSSTADLTTVAPLMAGIENINFNMTSFAEAKVDAVNMSSGTITMNQLQVGGSANATVNNASGVTVVAGTGITGTLTVEIDDLAESTVVNAGNAATVTQTSTGDTKAIDVTVNGSAASTSLTADSGNLGTTTINGTATDVTLSATGATMNVVSAYEGTAITGSDITVVGSSAATDVANVTLGGTVALTNTNVATVNMTSFADATVNITAASTTFDLAGTHDVTVSALVAEVSGKTVTTSGTGAYTVRVTDDLNSSIDASKFDNDLTLRLDDFDDTDTVTIDSGATIDYRQGTAQVLELVSSAPAGTTNETITVLANAANTEITNGTAGDGTGTDRFETVNIETSTVASAVVAIVGNAAITTGGSKALTLGGASTAASVTNSGNVALTVAIEGTSDITTITGSATATDTIDITANTGDDLSAFTLSNIDIIELSAAADYTLVLGSGQVSGKSISITGNQADANDAITITATESTIDLGSLAINTGGITNLTIDLASTASTTQNITGSNTVDLLSNAGAGQIIIDGKGGADTITTGTGADVITGGEGGDTLRGGDASDTYILTEATAVQDTVIVDWQAGEMDKVTGFNAGSSNGDLLHFDFSDAAATGNVSNLDDAANMAQADTPLLQSITLGSAFDMSTATANTNIMVFDGDITDAATLATAINDGGNTELKVGGAVDAGDSFFALYDNGVSSYFAEVNTATGVSSGAAATDFTVTNIVEFTDIADATTLLAANFDFIA